MFRYTPPWQVLCNSLDHDFKRQSSIVTGNPYDARIHRSQKDQSVINSHHSQRRPSSRPAQDPLPPRAPMTSKPKLWVIKPLSPKLEPSDLRSILSPTGQPLSTENTWSNSQDSESLRFNFDSISITGMQPSVIVSTGGGESNPDVVVQARQVAVSEDESDSEDWRPSSPGTPSSTSSHAGFYSFVDDPASPEAEMNEAYMVSPERQAKLNTLTEKSSFKLQTYVEEKRPGRLFQETNGDALYRVEDASPLNKEVESPDRMEIIRNQAPKKSPALKKQWSALENLDLSNTPQRLLDGFSLCYSPVSSKAEQAKAEPGTIDNEQINFNVARKQFLMMEQSKQNPFLQSPHQAPYSPKLKGGTLSSMASIFTAKQLSKENSLKENQIPVKKQAAADIKTVTVTADPENGVQSGAIDDSDSGLGDRGGGYASDGSISNDPSILEMESFLVPSVRETPIEREIRIAQEREENLRRSRGILRTDNSEMVEIRTTKPILSQPSPQLKSLKSKETNRVSFLIQRELEHEKLRKAQNRTSSLYNEGDQGEKEKRKISESDQVPITSLRTSPTESLINDLQQKAATQEDTWISEQPVLVEEGDTTDSEEGLSPCCPHRHPDESFLQKHYNENSNIGNQDGNFSAYPEDTIQSKVKIFQVNSSQTSNPRAKKEASWIAENDASMSTRNRLSSSNIPSSMEPIKNNQYVPIYRSHLERRTWSPQVQNAPLSIRQEIEQDLRREQELQELRESSSQFFSTNRGVDVSEPKTSVEQKPQPTSGEETVSSLEIPKTDLVEVDSVFPEKQKTDYSYPYSWNLDTHISTADKSSQLSSPRLASRLPSVAMMTPMPWGNPKPMSPTVSRVTPIKPLSPHTDMSSPLSQKGLTETLLKDFEERRVKLKLEESAYAGIQPVDEINNEVVEATRVIRHKNQRALQWEAGMYANEESK